MLELLKFILQDGYTFGGTLILLFVVHVLFGQSAQTFITTFWTAKANATMKVNADNVRLGKELEK